MVNGTILVWAEWDSDAKVFVATSDDVTGLVAEAATLDALHDQLIVLIPELMELNASTGPEENGPFHSADRKWEDGPLVVISQHVSKVRLYA